MWTTNPFNYKISQIYYNYIDKEHVFEHDKKLERIEKNLTGHVLFIFFPNLHKKSSCVFSSPLVPYPNFVKNEVKVNCPFPNCVTNE